MFCVIHEAGACPEGCRYAYGDDGPQPIKGEVCVVPRIPDCDFCQDGTPGPYDFATVMGPWGHGCRTHYEAFRAADDLGYGKGQVWVERGA